MQTGDAQDNSGRGKRSIEWRKRALEFAGPEHQQVPAVSQIDTDVSARVSR